MKLNIKEKNALKAIARTILGRVEFAKSGCHNSQYWDDPEDNLSAPEGMSYNDWIYDAERELFAAIDAL